MEDEDFKQETDAQAQEALADDNHASAPERASEDVRHQQGARAHFAGSLVAAYIGRGIRATRTKPFANHHELAGTQFQIRTISGSQNTFTVNRDTEPEKIIVAVRKPDKTLVGASRYMLCGVRRDAAFGRARKSMSRGHAKSGHHLVSISQVTKVEFGTVLILDEFVMADTAEDRVRLLARITTLAPDLDSPPFAAARAFLEQVAEG